MTRWVSPLFIHAGQLVYIKMNHPRQEEVMVPCEILSIKKTTDVEVCDLSTRTCILVPIKDCLIKVIGNPYIVKIKDSPFHNMVNNS